MNIIIATDLYYPSVNGASYFAQRLAAALAKRGHTVSVIAPSVSIRNTMTNHNGITVYGIRSVSIPIYPGFRVSPSFIARRTIRQIIAQVNPDIVHIQNHFVIGKIAADVAHKLTIATVGTNHFMPENLLHYLHMPKRVETILKDIAWWHFARIYRRLNAITTPTTIAASAIRDLNLGQPVHVISNGIDRSVFRPGPCDLTIADTYGIPRNRMIALYVGRLDKEKNLDSLIRALPEIIKKVNVQLVIAGKGALKEKLMQLVSQCGVTDRVSFTGFIPDSSLPALYRCAHIFVMAGTAELQSIATMEAMSTGLPIVAVRAMALPELVHDGENGFLFEHGDIQQISKHITTLLTNETLRKTMGESSLRIIEAHDTEKILGLYESLYTKAVVEK